MRLRERHPLVLEKIRRRTQSRPVRVRVRVLVLVLVLVVPREGFHARLERGDESVDGGVVLDERRRRGVSANARTRRRGIRRRVPRVRRGKGTVVLAVVLVVVFFIEVVVDVVEVRARFGVRDRDRTDRAPARDPGPGASSRWGFAENMRATRFASAAAAPRVLARARFAVFRAKTPRRVVVASRDRRAASSW